MESVRMAIAMVLTLIASYLIGCANFAIIISKLVYHKDIRDYGSGNAGMTNIARTFGKWPAVACTIGDFLKGTIAALLGHLFVIILGAGAGFDEFPFYGNYLVALGVMLGHCFPVFYGFRGGKGILVSAGVIDPRTVIIDAKSGVSGAGRKADVAYNANEVEGSFKAYAVATHRHTTEIEEKSGAVVTFVPHLLPIKRGILATIYCDLMPNKTESDAKAAYSVYDGEPFVHFLGNDLPEIKSAAGSNCCYIGLRCEEKTNRLIVVSCIDNLIKGASGQAVQIMNLIFGFDETAGLL